MPLKNKKCISRSKVSKDMEKSIGHVTHMPQPWLLGLSRCWAMTDPVFMSGFAFSWGSLRILGKKNPWKSLIGFPLLCMFISVLVCTCICMPLCSHAHKLCTYARITHMSTCVHVSDCGAYTFVHDMFNLCVYVLGQGTVGKDYGLEPGILGCGGDPDAVSHFSWRPGMLEWPSVFLWQI